MEKKMLEFKTEDGEVFYIEFQNEQTTQEGVRGISSGENRGIVSNVFGSFEKALRPLKEISHAIVNTVKEIANSPEEISVELALKFTAKAGIVLTSIDGEANLKIMLTWKKSATPK